jgi:hypothetical protein
MTEKNKPTGFEISWGEFQEINTGRNSNPKGTLYRGQSNAEHKLESTLARFFPNLESYCSEKYHKKILAIASTLANNNKLAKEIINKIPADFIFRQHFMYPPPPYDDKNFHEQAYATFLLMIHLRHEGIPSPLLDWSADPYVASFFAFKDMAQSNDYSAIFILEENNMPSKVANSTRQPSLFLINNLDVLNENLKLLPHHEVLLKRHHAQQSAYTISHQLGLDCSSIIYATKNREDYILNSIEQTPIHPCTIKKYIFSPEEKRKAFRELYKKYNNKKLYCNFSYEDLAIDHLYLDEK